jgi:predicted membrane channel-forming protein YqfA (hemolysin III family)
MSTSYGQHRDDKQGVRLQRTAVFIAAVFLLACATITVGVVLLDSHSTIARFIILIGVVVVAISGSLLGLTIHAAGRQSRLAPGVRR